MNTPIRKLVIAGGGTAGWMAAALLKKVLTHLDVELVESEDIGIVGVGEATIPPIQTYNQFLGLDEKAFLRETNASIKLAIRFENWKQKGSSYYHTFGAPGATVGFVGFQHYWLRAVKAGLKKSLWDYDLNYLASEAGTFNKIQTDNPVYQLPYAYHFDAALYGQFLRRLAEQSGVVRTEGKIEHVKLNTETGFVEALQLTSGKQINGDLFLDCTGMRGLLLQKALGVEYEDWSKWLCADSALAVPSERHEKTAPFTRSIARESGWQWRIPLTHRNGNGLVYSSRYMDDDTAAQTLMANLDTRALDEPRKITFRTGRTVKQWHRNVIGIGLSSGFLEPLESTSIHLIQSGIVRLLKMFPNHAVTENMEALYNAESKEEFETIRDFIILHYNVTERDDSEFWRDMRKLELPDRLATKIEAFRDTATLHNEQNDIFRDASWVEVMLGQGITPKSYHPSADNFSDNEILTVMQKIESAKHQPLSSLVAHDEFLRQITAN